MYIRKDAVLMAVAGLLATAGFAMADSAPVATPTLSLEPSVVTAVDEAPAAPAGTHVTPAPESAPLGSDSLLMQALGKVGAEKTLNDYGINVYGWVEGGYTYNHRHNTNNLDGLILPGPFNHEYGNHFMLNQLDLRIERLVDGKKWDVGGLVEVMYGSDAAQIHSSGMGFNGSDPTDNNSPNDPKAVSNLHPTWQFDIPQAYIDIGVPVGNGLKIRVGKFYTLLGYEHVEAPANTFYSHSYLFSMIPFTQTGVLAFYNVTDQLSVAGGITRGWNQTLEDGGPELGSSDCAIDFLGQVTYKINNQWTATVNLSVGPQNFGDTSHYRTAIDPIVTWQATDKLSFAAEGLYVYDGGRNGDALAGNSHAYGDNWGIALYGTYVVNDFVSVSTRLEKAHFSTSQLGANNGGFGSQGIGNDTNFYAITLGTTITPFPKDPIGKNLSIRPEVRYDYCEDHVFDNGTGHTFKDQLTFGADVIFKF
jgi:hypothetical protein